MSTHHDDGARESPGARNVHVPIQGHAIEVKVDERGVERALKRLRRVLATEGVLREVKRRRHYEKPSTRRNRKVREASRRLRKKERSEAGSVE